METPNMTDRPIHIKAVLFRLEPTTALLKTSQDLISKYLRLGIISRSEDNIVRQELRKHGFGNGDDMDVIISRPEIMRPKSGADLIHRAAQKMKVAVDNILFISPHSSEVRAVQQLGAITAWMRTGQRARPEASTGDFEILTK